MAPHHNQPRTAQHYIHQEITPKRPPGWDPSFNRDYPYEQWIKDLAHWSQSTDVVENKKSSLVILQLGGLARAFVDGLDAATIRDGGHVEVQPGEMLEMTGLSYMIWELGNNFVSLTVEVQTKAMVQFENIHRLQNETIDECLSRWELLRTRARQIAALNRGPMADSRKLLKALGIPEVSWPNLLLQFQGNMPQNEQQFTTLIQHLRRSGHILETRGLNDPSWSQQSFNRLSYHASTFPY